MADTIDNQTAELDAYFALTTEEHERLQRARTLMTAANDPDRWKAFARDVLDVLLESYQTGALDFRRMMAVMHGCALGCTTKVRVTILGVLAEKALAIDERSIGSARLQDYPAPIQRLAAGAVEFIREEGRQPKFEFVLEEAVQFLVAVGICPADQPVATGTLKNWYHAHKKAVGDPITRGRPPERH